MDERPLPAGVTVRRATLADAGVLGSMRAAMHAEIRGRPDVGPDVVAYATDLRSIFRARTPIGAAVDFRVGGALG